MFFSRFFRVSSGRVFENAKETTRIEDMGLHSVIRTEQVVPVSFQNARYGQILERCVISHAETQNMQHPQRNLFTACTFSNIFNVQNFNTSITAI
jgi:hypothetical protein